MVEDIDYFLLNIDFSFLHFLYAERVFFFWGELGMIRTIIMGSCVSVQGTFVRSFPDGRIAVKVGKLIYSGRPVVAAA